MGSTRTETSKSARGRITSCSARGWSSRCSSATLFRDGLTLELLARSLPALGDCYDSDRSTFLDHLSEVRRPHGVVLQPRPDLKLGTAPGW